MQKSARFGSTKNTYTKKNAKKLNSKSCFHILPPFPIIVFYLHFWSINPINSTCSPL